MKVEIEKDSLVELLSKVQRIVEKRTAMPILTNILVEAKDNKLKIFATNLEVSLTDHTDIKVITEGKVVINAKNIYEIVKELKPSVVALEKKENNRFEVKQGKSVYNLVSIDVDQYVALPPTFNNSNFLSVDKKILIEMIDKTMFSISNDESRYHLNGVYLIQETGDNKSSFKMVSTDGHRLSFIKREMVSGKDIPLQSSEGVIIPRKGLLEIKKLLEGSENKFSMAIEGAQLIVKSKNTVLMIRLIEGKYPQYNQLIPSDLNCKVSLDRKTLLSSLRRVSLLSNQKSKSVTLGFSKGKMEITSNNPEMGDAKEELDVDYSGDNLKIGFNAKFILDVLNSIEDEKVDLNFKDHTSPGLVQPKNDKDFTCVIMPMRI